MSEPSRYFRCAYPDSYYELRGEDVFYFAPHVPHGMPSQWTAADILRCAKRRPDTDGEASDDALQLIRRRLAMAIESADRIARERKALDESKWTDHKAS